MTPIRRVRADDWRSLRDLRLRALADAPQAFSATLAEARARDEAWWRESARRSAEDRGWVTFVGERDGQLIAMATGTFPVERLHALDDPAIASLIQMWVDPSARRSGLGRELIEAVAAWAAEHDSAVLRTGVTASERRAVAFYESLGFRDTGRREEYERLGTVIEMERPCRI
jgi:ribosomal protein S18 acetylase RimI-like enzyme